ncbi:MAG: hypothetical protein Q4C41_03390 [Eggerthellaceae bacterium]|nr:hypothetical protein [Eggerthellaceae bacterium]
MNGETKALELDPKDFKLNDYDNLRITMPQKPALSEEDVDAQLFEYVLSTNGAIKSVSELDDEWVRRNFEGLETLDDVRQAIKDDFDRETEIEYSDIKFHACSDALVERLEGEINEDVLESNVEAMRRANEQRLEAMNISMNQFLREESLTPEQYDQKLRDETTHQLRLNMALDLLADVLGMQVGNHEITEYLQTSNPQAFLEEIREKGMVEQARRAAVRVKTMRRAVDTAIVNGAVETPESRVKEKIARQASMQPDEDIEVPDFDHLPLPEIHDDNPSCLNVSDN